MNTDQVRQALERELGTTASRLRELGSTTDPRQHEAIARTDEPPGDSMDRIQTTETREQYFSSKELLAERAERLAGALERLRDGSYGTCAAGVRPPSPSSRGRKDVSTPPAASGTLGRPAG